MGLFTRFTDIINANLHNMLDKAEQPEKMIRLIIIEMEETLSEVRATAAKNIAEQKMQVRRVNSTHKSINYWHNSAELAVTKNREDLAKLALIQKHKYQGELSALEQENEQISECLMQVQNDAISLQEKLTEARRRQAALTLRQESAQVQFKVRAQVQTYNIEKTMGKFEHYQQKIDNVEAQVEAYDFMKSTGQNPSLIAEFEALEKYDAIEQELVEMKKNKAAA
jgi:phage shock protein A